MPEQHTAPQADIWPEPIERFRAACADLKAAGYEVIGCVVRYEPNDQALLWPVLFVAGDEGQQASTVLVAIAEISEAWRSHCPLDSEP